ncbi:hypothetical protein [Saccharomonospora piscinae]|uniref:hypothetical protein n=1 Tax=Saccharomonospora piscinae TaxID=687388 RepID=UPI000465D4D4|nr:hypothetical protein [Saccharomonospora piscinae]
MDLTAWLLRLTPLRPFVIATPGGTGARVAVERLVRERGWQPAASPAEGNILVVAGPVSEDLRPAVEQVWSLFPRPCARADIGSASAAPARLAAAADALGDPDRQRRPRAAHPHHDRSGAEPPMADRAQDRDGLMLDRLHVPLGPVLPDWPAGLVVRTALQGDVIQDATVTTTGLGHARQASPWDSPTGFVARRLDSCARLLSVVGWPDASATARRLRDDVLRSDVLRGDRRARTATALARWAGRVRRSRTLRWSLVGVGPTPPVPSTLPELGGDAWDRLGSWLDSAVRTFDRPGSAAGLGRAPETRWALEALPTLLDGTELACARILVASLDPDLDTLARREAPHG